MDWKKFRNCFWRVPLLAFIAGLLYIPCYVRIVLRFGVIAPGEIDGTVSLLTSGGLMVIFLLAGWLILLRSQTRREIFVSSSLVVAYGLILWAIQMLTGSTTGPGAVFFLRMGTPLEWMNFPSVLSLYLTERIGITVPFLGFLRFFVPWLLVPLGDRGNARG
ncbi:MAG: hypothetical protein HFF39_05445 [Lawsonibacter sp.]|nr:hypothetical protein [Lawsonibacter sp.]